MNVREYALDILDRVFFHHGYAGLLMRQENTLSKVDQAFASELIYGTIRNRTLLESYWKQYTKKVVKKQVEVALDMGVYQMYFMNKVPVYAAISTTVDLVNEHEKGFVNAILHKVEKQGKMELEDTFENASVNYSHPKWLLQLWKAHYGEDVALQIAKSDQEPSRLYGRINYLKINRQRLEKTGKFHFVNDISFLCDDILPMTKQFQTGQVVIQDIHSAMVAGYLEPKPGERILDSCSAPGTKAQQIAMMMKNEGELICCDLHPSRTKLIDQLMKKTGVTIAKVETKDATVTNQFKQESFDRVLIDAPCSGLGDLSGKPEIRWHIRPENLDQLINTQRSILEANAPYLKKGGRLVYSTCTLNRKENEVQISNFLKSHSEFELKFERTLFPFEDDGDGFYVAVLEKK